MEKKLNLKESVDVHCFLYFFVCAALVLDAPLACIDPEFCLVVPVLKLFLFF